MSNQQVLANKMTTKEFWEKARMVSAEICNEFRKVDRVIKEGHLNALVKRCADELQLDPKKVRHFHPYIKLLICIDEELERLDKAGKCDRGPLAIPAKAPRPSVIPDDQEKFIQSAWSINLVDYFWNTWLPDVITQEGPNEGLMMFSLAFVLVTQGGFGNQISYPMLLNLKPEDVTRGLGLRVKVHPRDRTDKYSFISLPTPARLLLAVHILNMRQEWKNGSFIFYPDPKACLQLDENGNRVKSVVHFERNQYYSKLSNTFKEEYPTASLPKNWQQFTRIASIIPVLDRKVGLEPYIHTVQSSYPLPVSHPDESQYALLKCNGTYKPTCMITKKMARGDRVKRDEAKEPELVPVYSAKSTVDNENPWCTSSNKVITNLIKKINNIKNRANEEGKEKENKANKLLVRKAIHEASIEADNITNNQKSALHLALAWAESKVNPKGEIAGVAGVTVRDELYRAFTSRILADPQSEFFNEWEPEDHAMFLEGVMEPLSGLELTTQNNVTTALNQVYQYGKDHGFIQEVDIDFSREDWLGATPRNELVGLGEFDEFINELKEKGRSDRISRMLAVVCILGFYGGMRSSEVSLLSMNNIERSGVDLFVNIHRGKSAAARRRIPLSYMAPKHVIEFITEYYDGRRKLFQKGADLRRVGLFGNNQEGVRYSWSYLIDKANNLLKSSFGSGVTMHTLRHSSCSWLFVRMCVARYPELREELTDGHHDLFSTNFKYRTTFLFSGERRKSIPDYCNSSLIRLSKLMGHMGQATTFKYYIHSFHLMQKHGMERASTIYGQRILDPRLIANLTPGMKLLNMRSKKENRKINQILDAAIIKLAKKRPSHFGNIQL